MGAGPLDLLFNPFYMQHGELPASPDTTVLHLPLLSTAYLGLPFRPPFDDARVRRALAHALDRASLESSVARPATGGFLPPAMPGHSHDAGLRHDPGLARSLLAEAGYPEGRGLPAARLIQADPGFGDETRRRIEARWESQWRGLNLRVEQVGFRTRTSTRKPTLMPRSGTGPGQRLPRPLRHARALPRHLHVARPPGRGDGTGRSCRRGALPGGTPPYLPCRRSETGGGCLGHPDDLTPGRSSTGPGLKGSGGPRLRSDR